MKTLLFAAVLLISSCYSKPGRYIEIKHIGPSDKPISTIIIANGNVKILEQTMLVFQRIDLGSEDYDLINDEITKTRLSKTKTSNLNNEELALFEILVHESDNTTFVINHKDSKKLFQAVISDLKEGKHDKELLPAFENVLKRIDW